MEVRMRKAEVVELADALEKIGYEIIFEDRIASRSPFGNLEETPVKGYKRFTVTLQRAEAPENSSSVAADSGAS
jgi:hypothetical protein